MRRTPAFPTGPLAALWREMEARPYLAAACAYLLSRAVVLAAMAAAPYLLEASVGPHAWSASDAFHHRLLRWDSRWYLGLATEGYGVGAGGAAPQAIAFFPLYPLVARFLAALGLSEADALLVVANVFGLAAALLMVAVALPILGARGAVLAAALLAASPTAFFLSAGYTESLALTLCLGAFVLMARRRFMLAALLAGIATATRSAAAALAPILVLVAAIEGRWGVGALVLRGAALGALAVSGLLAFMAYQLALFGDPFAFSSAQGAWAGPGSGWDRLVRALTLQPLFTHRVFETVYFLGAVGLIVAGARRLPWPMTAFAALTLAIPYLTLAGGAFGLASMPRFVLMAFPVFLAAAALLTNRPRLALVAYVLCLAGQFYLTLLFTRWWWVS